MLALGAASAAALAKSRTMEALVLKRSAKCKFRPIILLRRLTITGHAGFARDTSGNEDNLGVGERLLEAGGSRVVAGDGAVSVDVGEISSDA